MTIKQQHTPTPPKMPFLTMGNRLSEFRERVESRNESTAYTCELIDDAVEALKCAVNRNKSLIDELRNAARILEKHNYNVESLHKLIAQAEGK